MNEQIPPIEGSQPISAGPEQQPATASPEPAEPEKLSFLENLKQEYAAYEASVMEKLSTWRGNKEFSQLVLKELAGGALVAGVSGILLRAGYDINDPIFSVLATGMLGPGILAGSGSVIKSLVDLNLHNKYESKVARK